VSSPIAGFGLTLAALLAVAARTITVTCEPAQLCPGRRTNIASLGVILLYTSSVRVCKILRVSGFPFEQFGWSGQRLASSQSSLRRARPIQRSSDRFRLPMAPRSLTETCMLLNLLVSFSGNLEACAPIHTHCSGTNLLHCCAHRTT
jgi:hypothetical protein